MFGNGVTIGMELMISLCRLIREALHQALPACVVAAVGTTTPSSRAFRLVAAVGPTAAATLASALPAVQNKVCRTSRALQRAK